MPQSLNKYERKLVAQGSAKTGKRLREQGRSARLVAVPTAIGVAKAEAVAGAMIPTFTLPVLGQTKASTLIGYGLCAAYALSRNPGIGMTTLGLSGLALAARGQKA